MRLEWNLGGWFGGQLGGTLWILVAAVLSAVRDLETGALVLVTFLIPNIIGTILWRRRDRLSCYIAIQMLLPLVGVFSLLAVYILDSSNQWLAIQSGGSVSAMSTYGLIILVVALLMLVFYFRFGRNWNKTSA